jgi:hypothetical protein
LLIGATIVSPSRVDATAESIAAAACATAHWWLRSNRARLAAEPFRDLSQ